MIDTLALALGHGLLAIALLRMAMRDDLDVDPAIAEAQEQARADRAARRKLRPSEQVRISDGKAVGPLQRSSSDSGSADAAQRSSSDNGNA